DDVDISFGLARIGLDGYEHATTRGRSLQGDRLDDRTIDADRDRSEAIPLPDEDGQLPEGTLDRRREDGARPTNVARVRLAIADRRVDVAPGAWRVLSMIAVVDRRSGDLCPTLLCCERCSFRTCIVCILATLYQREI